MADRHSTLPLNTLVVEGPLDDTLEACRDVLAVVRRASVDDGVVDARAGLGVQRILGMVEAALSYQLEARAPWSTADLRERLPRAG